VPRTPIRIGPPPGQGFALSLALAIVAACPWRAAAETPTAPPSAAAPASDQNSVIVHASKKAYDRQIQDFVDQAAAKTRIGQLSRWNDRICPVTVGLTPDLDAYVSDRILALAKTVGAPAGELKSCRPNMVVVFSPDPQGLLDKVLKTKPHLLGWHYTDAEAKHLAVVDHPVQAWYATATQDYHGRVTSDDPSFDWTPVTDAQDILDNATAAEGSRLRSGLQSQFASVLVVADTSKIVGRNLGAVGDYIAVLALTRAKDQGGCRDLPSITELFSPDCADSSIVLQATAGDLAYLRGLYSVNPTLYGDLQQGSIASEMKASLKAR